MWTKPHLFTSWILVARLPELERNCFCEIHHSLLFLGGASSMHSTHLTPWCRLRQLLQGELLTLSLLLLLLLSVL